MTKVGPNTLVLTGVNTYPGDTVVSGGTLQLGDGTAGDDGTLAGNIVNNSVLAYYLNGNPTYAGAEAQACAVTKSARAC